VAIEHQGQQHDRAVDFFGGEDNYKMTVKRDKRKQRLCKKHRVKLIYVREGYQLSDVLDAIITITA